MNELIIKDKQELIGEDIKIYDLTFKYWAFSQAIAKAEKELIKLKAEILNTNYIKVENLVDGYKVAITNTIDRTENTVNISIDFNKAIEYAKTNNLTLPMTEPKVDISKLELEDWFQQNIKEFKVYTEAPKIIKGQKRLLFTELKL